jgi:hypothetical protein
MTADILGVDAQGQTTWGLHEVVEEDSTTLIATGLSGTPSPSKQNERLLKIAFSHFGGGA